jgi:hypothetical protein
VFAVHKLIHFTWNKDKWLIHLEAKLVVSVTMISFITLVTQFINPPPPK